MFPFLGIIGQKTLQATPKANSVLAVLSSLKYSLTFTYTDPNSHAQSTPKSYAKEIIIVNSTIFNGTVQSASYVYFNLNSVAESGSPTYRWFQANDSSGSGETVVSTSSTYTPTITGKYIDVGITVSSVDGVGIERRSGYRVVSASFDILTSVAWDVAFDKRDLVNYGSNNFWTNQGVSAHNAVQDGAGAMPTYDATNKALKFIKASSQRLAFSLPSPQMTQPWELWIRFKCSTTTAAMIALGLTGTHQVRIETANGVTLSGVVTGFSVTDNQWMILQCVVNGASTVVNADNGTPATISVSTGSLGTGTAKIGCQTSSVNFFDGWISHIFMKDTPLDSTTVANMWASSDWAV